MNDNDIFEPDAYDYYDYDAMEKLQNKRDLKYIKLMQKLKKAHHDKDEKGVEKTTNALLKHRKQDKILKEKCRQSGYYWD